MVKVGEAPSSGNKGWNIRNAFGFTVRVGKEMPKNFVWWAAHNFSCVSTQWRRLENRNFFFHIQKRPQQRRNKQLLFSLPEILVGKVSISESAWRQIRLYNEKLCGSFEETILAGQSTARTRQAKTF